MKINLSKNKVTGLVLLRVLIGWHFLYEGISKLYQPGWSAKGYLMSSEWIFSGFFKWLGSSEVLLPAVNAINIGGLVLVGLFLILGVMERYACWSGALLLALYYLAHPPLPGLSGGPSEGSYVLVNKNLIELAALLVLAQFTTGHLVGLERLVPTVVKKRTIVSNL
ncbi:MAG: DoxX family membrane protein [Cytophagales bacterium]|nr:DoxX family membrane protein [Cytophagales bacterium]